MVTVSVSDSDDTVQVESRRSSYYASSPMPNGPRRVGLERQLAMHYYARHDVSVIEGCVRCVVVDEHDNLRSISYPYTTSYKKVCD